MNKIILITILFSSISLFSQVSVPNSFSSGDTISASEMNANFQEIVDVMNSMQSTISTLSNTLSDAETTIETLQNEIDSKVIVIAGTSAGANNGETISPNDGTTLIFPNEVIDTHNAYSNINGAFITPIDGTVNLTTGDVVEIKI